MVFMKKDLATMPPSIEWTDRVKKLTPEQAHALLPRILHDSVKVSFVVRHFSGWTAHHMEMLFNNGEHHYHNLSSMLPLAKGECVSPQLVDSLLEQGKNIPAYNTLVHQLADYINPTPAQVFTFLERDYRGLLDAWVRHNGSVDELWKQVVYTGQVRAAQAIHSLQRQTITTTQLVSLGNTESISEGMIGFLLTLLPAANETVVSMLVHFNRRNLLKDAWRKTDPESKTIVIDWLWNGENGKHRESILKCDLVGIPPQQKMLDEAREYKENARYLNHFLSQGW